jgi:collagen type I/II/III/V/XI/XXIV/XXVII alpha
MSTISNTITTGITIGVAGYTSPLTVTKTGRLSRTGKAAIYDYAPANATIVNHGTILSDGGRYAIFLFKGNDIVDNTGTIEATHGNGIKLDSDGSVTNSAGGLISSAGAFYSAIYIDDDSLPSTIVNYGTISGATGIYFGGDHSETIIDGGTIIGTSGDAINLSSKNDLVQFQPGKLLIQGKVDGGYGTDTLEFTSGTSIGTLNGVGADFVNFADGTVDAGASWALTGRNTFGSGVTLTNDGSISVASYDALGLGPGGYLINRSGGSIIRAAGGGATAFNPAVVGLTGGASTIDNRGTIGNPGNGDGIYLQAGGTVTNGATNVTAALVYGSIGVYVYGHRGTITNYGTIAGSPSVSTALGIDLAAGGVVTNGAPGSTAALISGPDYGIIFAAGFGTLTNFGTLSGGYDAVHLDKGGSVVEAGKIVGGSHAAIAFGEVGGYGGSNNLLVLENGFKINGAITATGTANVVELLGSAAAAVTANYSLLDLSGFQTIQFAPGATNHATLVISHDGTLPGQITGFIGVHDTVDLTGLSDTGNDASTSFNTESHVLTVIGSHGTVALQLDAQDYSGVAWAAKSDGASGTMITPEAACFRAGTRIRTEHGEVAVEDLAVGDHVMTLSGERLPVQWIGTRNVNCRAHPSPELVWPIRIAAGAFAPGVPLRDLWVSPDHAVYVDCVLIPIRHLVNGRTVAREAVDAVSYYHVELPRHEVLLAEGLPAESYLETGGRSNFANGGEVMQLHPDFRACSGFVARLWDAYGYAPLTVTGPEVERVRGLLDERAAKIRSARPLHDRRHTTAWR